MERDNNNPMCCDSPESRTRSLLIFLFFLDGGVKQEARAVSAGGTGRCSGWVSPVGDGAQGEVAHTFPVLLGIAFGAVGQWLKEERATRGGGGGGGGSVK
ncbi:hypothetical protein AMELA_G00250670 [Ameiurus melas]|uniref:Uncharacterized protein n=1 Tax=Ameiurus melas TaxID=219545 RepID=A0A7J5ZWL4_AMEME|nr:hypothetical protein AMELA_G00250670 [Ameiurus melas]